MRKRDLVVTILVVVALVLAVLAMLFALNIIRVTGNVVLGTGDGLTGNYYNNYLDMSGDPTLTRADNKVDFNWGLGAPLSGINAENFGVIWTGYIEPLYSENYTFYATSDDGVKLFVNDQLVISNWRAQPATEKSGVIYLEAGNIYPIRIEYFDSGWNAFMRLQWSSDSQVKEVVPMSALYTQVPSVFSASAISKPSCKDVGGVVGWYNSNNVLVRTDNCLCVSLCKYEGTSQEGFYNSCTNALIVLTQCVPKTQCSDKIDNDGDKLVDMNDPGCLTLQDDNETDVVSSGCPVSADRTTITPGSGTLTDKDCSAWTVTSGKQITLNGTLLTGTNNVDSATIKAGVFYQYSAKWGSWWYWNAGSWITTSDPFDDSCKEADWSCSAWNTCANGVQTRTCTRTNLNCVDSGLHTATETQSCGSSIPASYTPPADDPNLNAKDGQVRYIEDYMQTSGNTKRLIISGVSGSANGYIVYRTRSGQTITLGNGAGKDDGLIITNSAYVKVQDVLVENQFGGVARKATVNYDSNLQVYGAAVRVTGSNHIILQDVSARNNYGTGIGVVTSSYVTIRGTAAGKCVSYGNGLNGIGGSDSTAYVLVHNCESYNNNLQWKYNSAWEGGGGKWYRTDHVTVDGGKYHDNAGPGIWFDYQNTNFIVRNVEAYSNIGHASNTMWEGMGVSTEINAGPGIIQNNYFHDNSAEGIAVWEAMNTQILNNRFVNDGISTRIMRTRKPYFVYDLTVKGNQFTNGGIGGGVDANMLRAGSYPSNTCSWLRCSQLAADGYTCLGTMINDGTFSYPVNANPPTGCSIKRCIQNNPGLGWDAC